MKKAISIILSLILCLSLASCGAQPSEEQSLNDNNSTPENDVSDSTENSDNENPGSSDEETANSFRFTRENFPRLDGSTSTVPFAQAVCSVLLGESREQVSDLVSFSRTTASYQALMSGEADLLLAAEPEAWVLEQLQNGDKWLMTPFAIDALVFIVQQDNPVDSLTIDQVRQIYSGEITNWSQVGGNDEPITAFQRNSEAGSQALIVKLVMGETPFMDPPADYIPSMEGMMTAVRDFDNGTGALGYTVYYYASDMKMAEGLKILSIDGVSPSDETIASGEYPLLNPYFVSIAKDTQEGSPTRVLYDWILSTEGQALVEHEGYTPVGDTE